MQLLEKVKIISLTWLKAKNVCFLFGYHIVVAATPCLLGDRLTVVYHYFDGNHISILL